ncbi:hypothetical protein Ancab_033558 [Ancistrocladus abbreviatus]
MSLVYDRYAGYPLYECSHDKTWRFVQDHLFSGSGSKDNDDDVGVERAFRVIEVELHFLYDYFYTKYCATHSRVIPKKLIQLCIFMMYCWIVVAMLFSADALLGDNYYNGYYRYHFIMGGPRCSSSYDKDVVQYSASKASILDA